MFKSDCSSFSMRKLPTLAILTMSQHHNCFAYLPAGEAKQTLTKSN